MYDCLAVVKVVQVISFKGMEKLIINGRMIMFVCMCENDNGDFVLQKAVVYSFVSDVSGLCCIRVWLCEVKRVVLLGV